MQWQLVFFSMFPVLAFAAIERFGSQRSAVYAAVLVAAVECLYNSIQLSAGFVEPFSLSSLGLFALLGFLALRYKIVLVKFQPVAMELLLAGVFWIYQGSSGEPLLPLILDKYVGVNELIPPYQRGYFAGYAATMSVSLPFLLVFHAGLTAYAAVALSTGWWLQIRVVGFYVLVVSLFYYERLFQVTY